MQKFLIKEIICVKHSRKTNKHELTFMNKRSLIKRWLMFS